MEYGNSLTGILFFLLWTFGCYSTTTTGTLSPSTTTSVTSTTISTITTETTITTTVSTITSLTTVTTVYTGTTTSVNSVLFDDFEDANLAHNFGGNWVLSPEGNGVGGSGSMTPSYVAGASSTATALHINYTLHTGGTWRQANLQGSIPSGSRNFTAQGIVGIAFWYKSSTSAFFMRLDSPTVSDFSYYVYNLQPNQAGWTYVSVNLRDFVCPGWGMTCVGNPTIETVLTNVNSINFLANGASATTGSFEIDQIRLIYGTPPETMTTTTTISNLPAPVDNRILVNQVGYLTTRPKIALVENSSPGTTFYVYNASTDSSVFTGSLSTPANSIESGEDVASADFSAFTTPGTYYVYVPGINGVSYPFEIGDNLYQNTYYTTMRSFYGQRCNSSVDMGAPWIRNAGHSKDGNAIYHSSSPMVGEPNAPSLKGWYDAGDYNKYVVNSGISTGTLLQAYLMHQAKIGSVDLGIPETGNGVPDILNEIRWNLEWMLTMQIPQSFSNANYRGAVHHKLSSLNFSGIVMPEDDNADRYFVGYGTCATADFAAVMALAYRAFLTYDAAFANQCLTAAENAWTWLSVPANQSITYNNPVDVSTGEYGDGNCNDELIWASAELFAATGNATYRTFFDSRVNNGSFNLMGWPNVESMGKISYYNAPGATISVRNAIGSTLVNRANAYVTNSGLNLYKLPHNDWNWGSNSSVLNAAIILLWANQISPNPNYENTALEAIHYILGRNSMRTSYVTGIGSIYPKNVHHRPSGADGVVDSWPGLLSGGPNFYCSGDGHPCNPTPRAKSWGDVFAYYAANEIAINWNAPLVFVLSYFY